jgi:integrase/recombinase XerD
VDIVLPPEEERITVGDVIEDFLADCQLRNLSDKTLLWYRIRMEEMLGDVHKTPLASLTLAEVKARLAALVPGRKPTTVNGYVRTAKAMFYWACDQDLPVQFNPRKLHPLKEPQRVLPTLTPEQIKALLAQPDQGTFLGLRNYSMMMLMLDTGARISEVLGLQVADVVLPLIKVYGKGSKERMLALSLPMQKAMRRYLRARELALLRGDVDTPWLFVSRLGTGMASSTVNQWMKRYAEEAGIKGVRTSPHSLRFTFATLFLRNGGSITNLQQILGHTTLAMSRRYATIADQDAFHDSMEFSPIAQLARRGK